MKFKYSEYTGPDNTKTFRPTVTSKNRTHIKTNWFQGNTVENKGIFCRITARDLIGTLRFSRKLQSHTQWKNKGIRNQHLEYSMVFHISSTGHN